MRKKGFTLIELVIVMAIIVIAMSTLTSVVVFATNYYQDEYSESVTQEDLRLVAVLMEKDIRRYLTSDSYYSNSANTTITFGNTSADYVIYSYDNVNFTITRTSHLAGVVSSQIVGKQIQSLTISYSSSPYPKVDITIQANIDGRVTNNDIQQSIYIRLPKTGTVTSS